LGFNANDISGDSTRLYDFTRLINARYRQAVAWVWKNTGDWQFDDSNFTTLPIATADLVAGQQDYELPSTAQKIARVEVKDNDGDWIRLDPIDWDQIDDALPEYLETDDLPIYYDLVGRSIFLYPAPSSSAVTTSNGLKVYVARDVDSFTYNDTTQEPGIPINFHRLLSLGASLDYSIGRNMTKQAKDLQEQLNDLRTTFSEFTVNRDKAFKSKLSPTNISTI